MKPQAHSDAETAVREGPALEFLISPQVRTLGPPEPAFGVPHPTQSPQTLSSAPELRGRPAGCPAPGSRRRRAQWARPGRETPQLSGVDAGPPALRAAPRWPCSGRRPSALWGLRIDRRFQSPGTRPPRCSFVPDSWALSLQAGSPLNFPVFSWQKESLSCSLKPHPAVPGWARTTKLYG